MNHGDTHARALAVGDSIHWWPMSVTPPARVRIMFIRKDETTPRFGRYGVDRQRKFLGHGLYATVFQPIIEDEEVETSYGEADGNVQHPITSVRLWCIAPEVPL